MRRLFCVLLTLTAGCDCSSGHSGHPDGGIVLDEGVDSGPIILQEAFELPYARDIAVVEQRIHEIEHRLLPRAVSLIAGGKVSVDPSDPRWVVIDE